MVALREAPRLHGLPSADGAGHTPGWCGYGGLPLVIEGVASEWAAVGRWTAEHLVERCGAERVTAFVTDESMQGTVLQQVNKSVTASFAEIVRHIFGIERRDPDLAYYLRVEPGMPVYEELSADFEIPDIGHEFNPQWSGIWMGQAGNATPFHNDQWHGLLFQISGRKRYTMVHPFDAVQLQRNWRPAAKYDLAHAEVLAEDAPELAGLEQCYQGILSPGEVLYVPPFWMHQVVTIDDGNISMPIRFNTTQSPDVSLFQFSQRSCLRDLTNQPVYDTDTIVEFLRTNRAHFAAREREFVEALLEVRKLDIAPATLLAAVAQ
ncbi:MAG TPA: cupin-like domain-containing protein [Actinophytocola sp.]|uniref:cupin-like domain-containing protein n=1 Tax=Actinophytocola sp. TaxID=1872138 RepID=UPI002DDD2C93|nr:cupin-like domain-containing protein [Actinophytocola sp.]HEV2778232.1 cupin-like domain-containing protein [Actinophytocola sp.]